MVFSVFQEYEWKVDVDEVQETWTIFYSIENCQSRINSCIVLDSRREGRIKSLSLICISYIVTEEVHSLTDGLSYGNLSCTEQVSRAAHKFGCQSVCKSCHTSCHKRNCGDFSEPSPESGPVTRLLVLLMLVYVSPHLVSACYTDGYSTCSPYVKIMLISYKMWEYLVIFGNILSNLR